MANEVKIVINADGTAAIQGIEQVTGSIKRMESETKGIVSKFKEHWLGISAAIAGALIAINKAWSLAEMYAKFEQQKVSLNTLAQQYSTTADQIISDIKRASQGMISMADAVAVSTEGLMKGLSPHQIVELASAAETLANVTGQKTAVEFRNLTSAIALGKEQVLETSIGIIDLNARFGEQVNKMNDVERASARYNLVMERVREIQLQLGDTAFSNADKMGKMQAKIEDVKLTLGKVILTAEYAFVRFGEAIGEGAYWWYEKFSAIFDFLKSLPQKAFEVGKAFIKTLAEGMMATPKLLYDTLKKILGPLGRLLPSSDAEEGPLSNLTGAGRAIPETIAEGIRIGSPPIVYAIN